MSQSFESVKDTLFRPAPVGVKEGGKSSKDLSCVVCPILENTRESRPNQHAKPAEPAGAPRACVRKLDSSNSDPRRGQEL